MIERNGRPVRDLYEALMPDGQSYRCISLVGGGGKTTFMKRLSEAMCMRAMPHVLMTTTNMMYPAATVYEREGAAFEAALRADNPLWAGTGVEKNGMRKLAAPTPALMRRLTAEMYAGRRTLIIEADGARRRPVKVPRDYEPVILPESDVVVIVVGLDALSGSIAEVAARPEDVATFLKKKETDRLTCSDLVRIILSSDGLHRGIPDGTDTVIVLNKADNEIRHREAEQIRTALRAQSDATVLVTRLMKRREDEGTD
ncbi:MAG: selenium cofactor biosynthesis protein YqeC [Eubacteriales bacterium]|nr:selenium cofactor biosynthesis protein YqeC [Eubacteriales bacterium]